MIPKYLWFINPCRKCIVRACCSKTCSEYSKRSGQIEDMTIKLLIPFIFCTVFVDEVKNKIIRVFGNVEALSIVIFVSCCMIAGLGLYYTWKGM